MYFIVLFFVSCLINHKVETVGDMYMAVSGLPDPCADHAKCIAKLALNMMDESKKVALPSGSKIQVDFSGFAEMIAIDSSVLSSLPFSLFSLRGIGFELFTTVTLSSKS